MTKAKSHFRFLLIWCLLCPRKRRAATCRLDHALGLLRSGRRRGGGWRAGGRLGGRGFRRGWGRSHRVGGRRRRGGWVGRGWRGGRRVGGRWRGGRRRRGRRGGGRRIREKQRRGGWCGGWWSRGRWAGARRGAAWGWGRARRLGDPGGCGDAGDGHRARRRGGVVAADRADGLNQPADPGHHRETPAGGRRGLDRDRRGGTRWEQQWRQRWQGRGSRGRRTSEEAAPADHRPGIG